MAHERDAVTAHKRDADRVAQRRDRVRRVRRHVVVAVVLLLVVVVVAVVLVVAVRVLRQTTRASVGEEPVRVGEIRIGGSTRKTFELLLLLRGAAVGFRLLRAVVGAVVVAVLETSAVGK